jgi:hypothetical protein
MSRYSISDLIKFLLGLLLVQTATGVQVLAALRSENREIWLLFALLSLTLGSLAALWFTSIVNHARKDATARVKDDFSREREKIRLRAEREKTRVIEKSHQQIIKARDRSQAKANVKVGASFAGVLALGGIMLFSQFFTLGMLLMTTAGGALAGYSFRARQEHLNRKRNPGVGFDTPEKRIGPQSTRKIVDALVGSKNNSG